MTTPEVLISWQTHEYHHRPRSSRWFLVVGGLAAALPVGARWFNNFLLAIILVVGTITLFIYSQRQPEEITCAITTGGVLIKDKLYPFYSLQSFWLHHGPVAPQVSLKSDRVFFPKIILPVSATVELEELREHLLAFLDEDRHDVTLLEALADYLIH